MIKTKQEINYEIQLIINKNLYHKKIITEGIYKRVDDYLLKMLKKEKIDNR